MPVIRFDLDFLSLIKNCNHATSWSLFLHLLHHVLQDPRRAKSFRSQIKYYTQVDWKLMVWILLLTCGFTMDEHFKRFSKHK